MLKRIHVPKISHPIILLMLLVTVVCYELNTQ